MHASESTDPLMIRLLALLRAGEPEASFGVMDEHTIAVQVRGADFRLSLDQLRIWLKSAPDAQECIRHTVRSWLACMQPSDDTLPLEQLAPMIKPSDWGQGYGDPDDPLLSVELDTEYQLLIAIQSPMRLCFAARRHQLASGLELPAIMSHALRSFSIQAMAGEGICWTQFDGQPAWLAALLPTPHLNASLALLPEVWEEAQSRLGGPCEVAFPDRETSLFFSAPDSAFRQEVLGWVERHRASEAYPLSPRAYRREQLWPAGIGNQ